MESSGIEGFKTVYIGGGTPSHVPIDLFHQFLSGLRPMLGAPIEYTVEANPESLKAGFLDVLEEGGVNRLSMGIQTYNEKLLSWLGRPAGLDAIEKAESLLSERWKGRLSFDFLAGLPRDRHGLAEELERALAYGVGHVSLYELTIEDGTPLAADSHALSELPGEERSFKEWRDAVGTLEENGYARYEISNFALAGEESVHNLGYWRLNPYLGIGPGAASTLPGPSGPLRREETRDLGAWLDGSSASEEVLTPKQFALEQFLTSLRTSEGLNTARFEKIFGISPFSVVQRSLEKWESAGSLEILPDRIRPTSGGMELVDAVLSDLAFELAEGVFIRPLQWPSP